MKKIFFFAVLSVASAFPALGPTAEPPVSIMTAKTFRPCVWPNPCGSSIEVAVIRPCVWPNPCGSTNA